MTSMVEQSLTEIDAKVADLLSQCRTGDDVIAVASNLVFSAARVYRMLGGSQLVAAQLYHVADQEAGKLAEQEPDKC